MQRSMREAMTHQRRLICSLMAAWGLAACQQAADPGLSTAAPTQAIINGTDEPGFPAVGAIALFDDDAHRSYSELLCSGILIRRNWVLTAAHCVIDAYPMAQQAFLIGEHAERSPDRTLPEGTKPYGIKRGIRYPLRLTGNGYDIGLIELEEAVTDVDPMPLFEGDLRAYVGSPTKSIGFGTTSMDEENLQARRRSTDLRIHAVYDADYFTTGDHTGICFGDSGGPDAINIDGTWYVSGVHSCLLADYYHSLYREACLYPSAMTRVDAFSSWIKQMMGEEADCRQDPGLCHCPEACGDDGLCEPMRCGEHSRCIDLIRPDPWRLDDLLDAYGDLYSLTPEGYQRLAALTHCAGRMYGVINTGLNDCVSEWVNCTLDGIEEGGGRASCQSTLRCLAQCAFNPYDECQGECVRCRDDCLAKGDGEASLRAYAAFTCGSAFGCEGFNTEEDCMRTYCEPYATACEGDGDDDDDQDGGPGPDPLDGGSGDTGDAGEDDASEADATEDGGDAEGGDDASGDASVSPNDAAASADSEINDANKPSANDADIGEGEDDDGDEGCSAAPGSQKGGGLALSALFLFMTRRRRRM